MDSEQDKKKWFDRITSDVLSWARTPAADLPAGNRVECLSGGPKWRYAPDPQQLRNLGFTEEEIEERCGGPTK